MANPTLLTQPFAANGDKNVIPNTTAVQGAFSQDKGFPAECSLPLGAGGVAPSRQDFNGAFNMLSSLMYYAQKGYIWHWDAGQEYFVGCVVIDDTDGNMYQCIQDVAAGGSVPSADATNWKKFSTGGGGGRYLGEFLLLTAEEAEGYEGILKADGAEVSRTMYPDLNTLYASHGYPWGAGDGSTTFNLPNLIGRFAEGANTAGGYHEAGLPNIEGAITSTMGDTLLGGARAETVTTSGALGVKDFTGKSWQQSIEDRMAHTLTFDASKSNPIYGNSTTVQPPSALLLPYVVVFTDATADSGLVDMTQIAQDLANKANRSLSNVDANVDFVVDPYHDAEGNWYRVYKSGWVEQGGIYAVSNNNAATITKTVTFMKPFANRNYDVSVSYITSAHSDGAEVYTYGRTETSVLLGATDLVSAAKDMGFTWSARGMGAKE